MSALPHPLPEALLAHLEKLHAEGRIARQDDSWQFSAG